MHYIQQELLGSPGCQYNHLELIPSVGKGQLEVCGLFVLLEGILHRILYMNIVYRGILSYDTMLTLYPLEPFGNWWSTGET